jgi:hypothetical protein
MGIFDDVPMAGQGAAPSSGGLFDDVPVTAAPAPAATKPEPEGGFLDKVATVGEETGRAVLTAPISLIQGIIETGTSGLDLALGTSMSRPTTDAFEYIKGYTKPETKVGQVAEELTAFALGFIPVIGWLGRASSVARGTKVASSTGRFLGSAERFGASTLGKAALSSRAGLIGSTAVASGVYETVATPNGRATLSDAFDIYAPLKTEEDTGMMGRDEALRRLRNKARHGVFGLGASAAFDTALVGLGAGAKALGGTETASTVARGIRTGFDLLGKGAMAVPGVKPTVRAGQRVLAPLGGADPRVTEEVFDTMARIDRTENLGIKGYAEYESKLNKVIGGLRLPGKKKADVRQAEAALFRYLNGTGPRLTQYGDEVAKAADDLLDTANNVRLSFMDSIERELKNAPVGSTRAQNLQGALEKMQAHQAAEQGFLRRMFKVYKDPVAYYKSLNITGKPTAELISTLSANPRAPLSQYDSAVVEVSKNLHKRKFLKEEALEEARRVVNDAIGLAAINNGMAPEAAIKSVLGSMQKQAKEGGQAGLFSLVMPRLKLSPSLLKAREPMIDKSPQLRKLMGEIEDPKQLYLQTIGDMAKTTAALSFYRNITDDASRMVTPLSDAVPALRAGQRPLFVRTPDMANDLTGFDMTPFFQRAQEINARTTVPSAATAGLPPGVGGRVTPEKVIEDFAAELEQAGYVRLGTTDSAEEIFGGSYGALSGVYVAPEAFQAVTTPMRIGMDVVQDFLGVLTQLRGFSQKMTIVFNPETQVRNVVGNTLMLALTGNLGRHTDMFDVYKSFTTSLADMTDDGLRHMAETISLSGTSESSLVIKALQEYRQAGKELTGSGFTRKAIEVFEGKLPFRNFLENFYSNSDSFFKGVAVISEQNKLLRAFTDAGDLIPGRDPMMRGIPDRRLLEELRLQGVAKRTRSASNPELSPIEVIAADSVKDMFPIYNRVGAFVQGLDKFPVFGNFMSFASENIRNSINILDKGLKEMSFTVSQSTRDQVGEAAAKAFEQGIRGQGAQRLLAFVSGATILPQAMVRGSMSLTGTTPEQMDAMYSQLPPYTKGQDIAILSNDQKGKIEYYNLSSIMPYSFVVDPAKAALRGYNQAGVLGKGEVGQILDGTWAALSSYVDPFASQAMSTEKLIDVLPLSSGVGRGGRTMTGSQVYLKSDTPANQILSSIYHVTAPFIPGYFRELGEVRSGEFRPGRITRAALGVPGPQGEEYNLSAEFATFVTGLRPMELNLRRDFQFSGKEYSPRRQELKTEAMRRIKAPDRTSKEMLTGWEYYLDGLYREQGRLYADIQAARELGVDDRIIRRNLVREASLGKDEVNSIMRGQFHPGLATSEMMKEIRLQERQDEINRVTSSGDIPVREMNQMSRDRARMELLPVNPSEAAPVPAATPKAVTAPAAPSGLFDDVPVITPGGGGGGLFDDVPVITPGGGGSGSRSTQGAAPPPPAFDSVPAPSAPQLPTAPANRASLSPSLLGGDLASQMANMEIARRISGQ